MSGTLPKPGVPRNEAATGEPLHRPDRKDKHVDMCLLCGMNDPPSTVLVTDEEPGLIVGCVCSSHTCAELLKGDFLVSIERADAAD